MRGNTAPMVSLAGTPPPKDCDDLGLLCHAAALRLTQPTVREAAQCGSRLERTVINGLWSKRDFVFAMENYV